MDNFDATATEGCFIGVDILTFSTLMIRRVSNPGSLSPTISANISLTLPTTTFPNPVEHAGNVGGTNGKLDALDDRLYAAHIRNGRLWPAHNFRVSTGGVASTTSASRNAVRWYELQNLTTTPALVQSSPVFDNAATRAAARQLRVGKLLAPPPASPSSTDQPGGVMVGQSSVNVVVTGTSASGSSFYDPGSNLPAPALPFNHISATVTGGVTVNSITYTDPTHVTLNISTVGATAGPQDITITNRFEGAAPTADLGLSTTAQRGGNGCVDTNDNGADFGVAGAASPGPRNSASPFNSCAGAPSPPPTSTPTPLQGSAVVISQVYGASGGTGSPWKNDYTELFNRGSSPVNLYGWSVQYANTDAATWQKTLFPIGTVLQPGRYLLSKQGSGGGVGAALPAADITNTVLMNGVLGKVALVSGTAGLLGKCPASGTYVDFVGYGSAVSCFEGSAPAGDLANATAAVRNGGGCVDTNQNGADFTVQAASSPGPRNSASPANPCGTGPAASLVGQASGGAASAPASTSALPARFLGVEMGQSLGVAGIGLIALLAAGLLLRKARA